MYDWRLEAQLVRHRRALRSEADGPKKLLLDRLVHRAELWLAISLGEPRL